MLDYYHPPQGRHSTTATHPATAGQLEGLFPGGGMITGHHGSNIFIPPNPLPDFSIINRNTQNIYMRGLNYAQIDI